MTSRVTVAVDLAKTLFQVVVADERGKITERRRRQPRITGEVLTEPVQRER